MINEKYSRAYIISSGDATNIMRFMKSMNVGEIRFVCKDRPDSTLLTFQHASKFGLLLALKLNDVHCSYFGAPDFSTIKHITDYDPSLLSDESKDSFKRLFNKLEGMTKNYSNRTQKSVKD